MPREEVAGQVAKAGSGACFADFNSAGVASKRAAAAALPGTPVADVAVLAPVPRAGARTPLVQLPVILGGQYCRRNLCGEGQ